ncbi:MAG: serine hydrolase [Micromonosporaceae bacterium]
MSGFAGLEPALADAGGTVSVWCGPVAGQPRFTRLAGAPHYPASTMKLAVLAAAYRLADAGTLDLDAPVEVHNDFGSAAPGAARFRMDPDYDSDPSVWARLGETASLRWLARRMIVLSSNLATNLVLEHTGYAAATAAWRAAAAVGPAGGAGAASSVVRRGIEDYAAREAGIDNLVTAADLAALLGAIATDRIASAAACHEMRQVLLAQEKNDDLPMGLPTGTPVAHKNGWVDGIRHDAAIVYPADAPAYLLVACLSTPSPDERMRQLMARIAAASWAGRHRLDSPAGRAGWHRLDSQP